MFIQNYMTTDPQSIQPSASAREAWELLRTGGFHQSPVVDGNGNLLGIVTDADHSTDRELLDPTRITGLSPNTSAN